MIMDNALMYQVQTMAVGEQYLYTGSADLSLRVWSLDSLELVKVIKVS